MHGQTDTKTDGHANRKSNAALHSTAVEQVIVVSVALATYVQFIF